MALLHVMSEIERNDSQNELVYASDDCPISKCLNFSTIEIYSGAKQNCRKHDQHDLANVSPKQ